MRKAKIFSAAVFVLVVSNLAALSSASDMTGRWIVRWDNNAKNENPMSLQIRDERASGTYINDSKAACKVTGNIPEPTRELALTIVCPTWDIRMQGTVSADWKNAAGEYQAYGSTKGSFTMRKTP